MASVLVGEWGHNRSGNQVIQIAEVSAMPLRVVLAAKARQIRIGSLGDAGVGAVYGVMGHDGAGDPGKRIAEVRAMPLRVTRAADARQTRTGSLSDAGVGAV